MFPALVKIDVATVLTGQSILTLFQRADGASLTEPTLVWVFNFSNGDPQTVSTKSRRRDLRFWHPELVATEEKKLKLDQVIARILPAKKIIFHAGEVDQLFQLRPRTRIDFADLHGEIKARRYAYTRATLVEFLRNRWIGSKARGDERNPSGGTSDTSPQS